MIKKIILSAALIAGFSAMAQDLDTTNDSGSPLDAGKAVSTPAPAPAVEEEQPAPPPPPPKPVVKQTPKAAAPKQASGPRRSLVFICHKGLHYDKSEVIYAFKAYSDESRPVDNRPLFPYMLKYIKFTALRYKNQWSKMTFRRALFVPKMVNSDADAIKWVAGNDAAVSYISSTSLPLTNPDVEVCGKAN